MGMGKRLSVTKAAEILGVSKDTVYRYVREKLLEASKPRGILLIEESSINEMLERSRIE
jgi:excisionase family DNA binding protein